MVVGTLCVAIPMVLNGAIGAKLHVPFSVITSTFSITDLSVHISGQGIHATDGFETNQSPRPGHLDVLLKPYQGDIMDLVLTRE